MKALILAGGQSRRMGRDKATLQRPDGTRQLDALIQLVRTITTDIVISTNTPDTAPPGIATLADLHVGGGPLAALEAFHTVHPGESVLLLGCDLFLLDETTLHHLIRHHSTEAAATCFANRIDHRPEPLCAIYQPVALALAAEAVAAEKCCARRFLESLDPEILKLPNPVALDNANTPEELDEVFAKIKLGVTQKDVEIIYFAKLREARGIDQERVNTLACTTAGLYEELRFRHHLPLDLDALRCARNGDFCNWNTVLEADDEIVFIPPVAGG